MILRRLAVAALVAGLTLTACSGGNQPPPSAGGTAELGQTNDMNPQDPATLKDGGTLRLPILGFPDNFNPLQIDGNNGDSTLPVIAPTLPQAFHIAPDGSTTIDHDYFTDIKLTGTNPQVITYTINPKAVWSDGTPITWADIASQINATRGVDKAYLIAAPAGSDRVATVTRGVDDRQAVTTFAKPYAEWQGMLGILMPKVSTATPEAFNKASLNGPGPTAGPFIVTAVDRGAQRITLSRNPKWWGIPPRLDGFVFSVLDEAALIPALQNNAIDATDITSLDELTIARRTAGIAIRHAPKVRWYHLTFNGAPGAILADPKLRTAIAKGIDRKTIVEVTQRGLSDNPVPLNNHVYVRGQQGYQDNASVDAFDPEAAKKELDALGWKMNGEFRSKDGRQLDIRDVFYDATTTRQVGQIAQNTLAQIGVKLDLQAAGGNDLFSRYVTVGNFDIAQFGWEGGAFPLTGLTQIYESTGESNFGKIGTPEIDAKIEATLSELDPAKARLLANDVDAEIWAEGFSLPLSQSPGNVAVRANVANYGAYGLGDVNYTAIGFMKP